MAKAKKSSTAATPPRRAGGAKVHGEVKSEMVHVFVDEQNLFLGIVYSERGGSYRMDFGRLLDEASRDAKGRMRTIKSAYIAGVVPDDDRFWQIAENQGFTVRRGFLGAGGRSKQDDAYLITDIM